jgi:uncharacterized membrane protein YjdF
VNKTDKYPDKYLRNFSFLSVFQMLLILVTGLSMARQLAERRDQSVLVCALSIVLLAVLTVSPRKTKFYIPTPLHALITLFIFSSLTLGEVYDFYYCVPAWDRMLHCMYGFFAAAIGFSVAARAGTRPGIILTFALCFSLAIGVMWEFYEFAIDHFLGMDMQKDSIVNGLLDIGLYDTMLDLLMNTLGALAFAIMEYICARSGKYLWFARCLLITRRQD